MTTQVLFDRIRTWNSMYDQIEIPPSQNPEMEAIRQKVGMGVIKGKLNNASLLEVTPELIGTPAEKDLRKAIDLAKTFEPDKLDEIHNLLKKVQKYMYENRLY